MFSLGDELCGGFFYEVAFFNLVLSVWDYKPKCIISKSEVGGGAQRPNREIVSFHVVRACAQSL